MKFNRNFLFLSLFCSSLFGAEVRSNDLASMPTRESALESSSSSYAQEPSTDCSSLAPPPRDTDSSASLSNNSFWRTAEQGMLIVVGGLILHQIGSAITERWSLYHQPFVTQDFTINRQSPSLSRFSQEQQEKSTPSNSAQAEQQQLSGEARLAAEREYRELIAAQNQLRVEKEKILEEETLLQTAFQQEAEQLDFLADAFSQPIQVQNNLSLPLGRWITKNEAGEFQLRRKPITLPWPQKYILLKQLVNTMNILLSTALSQQDEISRQLEPLQKARANKKLISLLLSTRTKKAAIRLLQETQPLLSDEEQSSDFYEKHLHTEINEALENIKNMSEESFNHCLKYEVQAIQQRMVSTTASSSSVAFQIAKEKNILRKTEAVEKEKQEHALFLESTRKKIQEILTALQQELQREVQKNTPPPNFIDKTVGGFKSWFET